MKGFIKWLLGTTDEVVKEAKEAKEAKEVEAVEEAEEAAEEAVEAAEEAEEVDPGLGTGIEVEKFVDSETGREYKSARSLKAAITRRKNKAAGKTSKKKSKKSKK